MRLSCGLLRLAFAVISLTAWPASAQLNETDIAAAIQHGLTDKPRLAAVNVGGSGLPFQNPQLTRFVVLVSGPLNRIQDVAGQAAKEYRPFTRGDVTPEMLVDEIQVFASPRAPDSVQDIAWRAERIVIQTRTKPPVTIQPTRSIPMPVSWTNGFGAKVSGQGMEASFARTDLPDGELVIVIVTQGSETRLLLKKDQRARIR